MGRFGNLTLNNTIDFSQFIHQIDFIMETTGSVDKQHIDISGNRCLHCVKDDRSGVRPFFMGDHITAGPLAPDF